MIKEGKAVGLQLYGRKLRELHVVCLMRTTRGQSDLPFVSTCATKVIKHSKFAIRAPQMLLHECNLFRGGKISWLDARHRQGNLLVFKTF